MNWRDIVGWTAIAVGVLVAVTHLAPAAAISVEILEGLSRVFAFLEGQTSLTPAAAGDLMLVLALVALVLIKDAAVSLFNQLVAFIRWLFEVVAERSDPSLPTQPKARLPLRILFFAIFAWLLSLSAAALTDLWTRRL